MLGPQIFDDYCRYQLYQRVIQDPNEFERYGRLAVAAYQAKDLTDFKNLLQEYMTNNGMTCFNDDQCKLLATNLCLKYVSNIDARPVAPSDPVMIGMRVYDDECRDQLFQDILKNQVEQTRLTKMAIESVARQDLSEFFEYMRQYLNKHNMVCTGEDENIIFVNDLIYHFKSIKPPFKFISFTGAHFLDHETYDQYSKFIVCRKILQDPKQSAICRSMLQKGEKCHHFLVYKYLKEYCDTNNLVCPFKSVHESSFFKMHFELVLAFFAAHSPRSSSSHGYQISSRRKNHPQNIQN